jgi:hypothetical protein
MMAKKEMESKSESRAEEKKDMAQDKKMIKKAFGMHDKQLHENKKTNLTKLKKGGVTGQAMRAVGRNMARANNQRGK